MAAALLRAHAMVEKGDRQEAIDLLRRQMEAYPKSSGAAEAKLVIGCALAEMGRYDEGVAELAALVASHAGDRLIPHAVYHKCRTEWLTAPRSGRRDNRREAALQVRLIRELKEVAKDFPKSDAVPSLLTLTAEIAQEPELQDFRQAGDSMLRLYDDYPETGPDSLFEAAELYSRDRAGAEMAVVCFKRFLEEFPADARAPDALQMVKDLEED
jgi:outer membrane protein assembly factor BamD (BamD/ComL family)